jgi:hypothetical protein
MSITKDPNSTKKRFVDSEALELQALSQGVDEKAA